MTASLLACRPGGEVRVDQAAVQWCARVRPAIWLRAAGFAGHAEQVTYADAGSVWSFLAGAVTDLEAAKSAAWQGVAIIGRRLGTAHAEAVWAALGDATWSQAAAVATYRLAGPARAAGVAPITALLRTTARCGDPDPHRPIPSIGWDLAWDVPSQCACLAAWHAVAALAAPDSTLWTGPPLDAWRSAQQAVTAAARPALTALDTSLAAPRRGQEGPT